MFTFDLINPFRIFYKFDELLYFWPSTSVPWKLVLFIIQSYTCTVSVSCVMVSVIVSNGVDGASLTHPTYTVIMH